MRALIDECIDERFRNSLPEHDCQTARCAGLAGLKNGELLIAAETAKFDVFLTVDQGIEYQQNLTGRNIAIIIFRTKSLFGTRLGGTDINRALAYCQTLVQNPQDTILILISDLYEGGNREEMLQRVAALSTSGVQMIALLAPSDQGAPAFDHNIAAALASFGIPAFACTPDRFPDLMAAAIERRDLVRWASEEQVVKIQ
jgi:hypothetical protein